MTQFSDNNTDEQVDFTSKMKRAIDVQRIDTNLYMSKELWLPYGARGVFGGQVSSPVCKLYGIDVSIDCCSIVKSCLGYRA